MRTRLCFSLLPDNRANIFRNRWESDVNTYPALDSQLDLGPVYEYEYSTRYATTIVLVILLSHWATAMLTVLPYLGGALMTL